MQLLTALQTGKKYSVSALSKMFGRSRRTIFRDLEELRVMGVRFHYDAKDRSYIIAPKFFLRPTDLTDIEAHSLLILVDTAVDQVQVPYRNSALMAALKIESNLPRKTRQSCSTMLQNIHARVTPQALTPLLDKAYAPLGAAAAKKQKVNITYKSLYERKVINVELCPYRLWFNERAWYVVGFSELHKEVRTFKLNRIKELKVLNKRFLDGDDFDLDEYLGRAWSMIPQGRIYNIKLRFLPKVAENVAEVQWHSTQKVTHNSDGSATVEFRVDGLGEITWWVLGYGDQVQVLAPKALRKNVIEAARNMIKLNEQL